MTTSTDGSNPSEHPSVLFFGNDLMFQSKISSACSLVGLRLKASRIAPSISLEALGGNVPILVIVDLGTPNLDLAKLVSQVRSELPGTKLLGYGAHVLADQLEQASQSGFDMVLTRGQFDRDMNRILQSMPKS